MGWVALVLLVPYIGAIIYWIVRKPTQAEVDQAMLKNADTACATEPGGSSARNEDSSSARA